MKKTSLSYHCREIILGSLLGDGSLRIHKPYKNARFSFRHSISQKEYFFWKVKELKEISGKNCWWIQKGDGYSEKQKLRYQSRALESLTELYYLTHKRKKLVVRRKWLNLLTPLSLAIWWLDDGSLIANSRKGVFCTDCFSKQEVKRLARYLEVVWHIKARVGRLGKVGKRSKYYRLWIRSTEELKKFLRIILPYIKVSSMLPKVILLYKDSQLQQRWISEICQTTKFPKKTVERYLREKKSKWKNFRE